LSSSWPRNIINNSEQSIDINIIDESEEVSKLLNFSSPKCHFSALNNYYFEREPYQNKNEGFTRTISLSNLSDQNLKDQKNKCFYGFNFQPDVSEKFEKFTKSPFESERRETKQNSHNKKSKIEDKECWFCLSNEKVETHLIASIEDESYVTLSKGGINEDHLIIIPINHESRINETTEEVKKEMDEYIRYIKKQYEKEEKEVIVFLREFDFKSKRFSHFHVQVLPLEKKKSEGFIEEFIKLLKESGNDYIVSDDDDKKNWIEFMKFSVIF
jgi:diadenosine tetraphosphate (Ap4A) HIT family hydrolase